MFFFEFFLRITGVLSTQSEILYGHYLYSYRQAKPSWFHTWKPNEIFEYKQSEFSYFNSINELGHREKSLQDFLQNEDAIKIVCIGDSFTEGDGAPYDSTWVKRLEYLLNLSSNERTYSLYNAGVCGSDVFYNGKFIENKLHLLKPDMVIEALNTSDLNDIHIRGGDERFNSDGTTTYKSGPKWEFFFKNLHIFRLLVRLFTPYDSSLVNKKVFDSSIEIYFDKIFERINKNSEFCEENGIKYILIIHPVPAEILNNSFPDKLNQYSNSGFPIINISDKTLSFFSENNIEDYSWYFNGHYNSKGYKKMGDFIFEEFNKKQLN